MYLFGFGRTKVIEIEPIRISFRTVFFIFMRNIASEKQYMTYVCSISVSI